MNANVVYDKSIEGRENSKEYTTYANHFQNLNKLGQHNIITRA